MSEEEHKQPPKTIAELGIHFGYIREDVAELKDILERQATQMATKSELYIHEQRITKLEKTLEAVKNRIVTTAVSLLVVMVLAVYGLDKYL